MRTYYPPRNRPRYFGGCNFTELNSYNTADGVKIVYECSTCGHHVTLPEQQGFRYCYLCGGEVRKIRSNSLTWNPLNFERMAEHDDI